MKKFTLLALATLFIIAAEAQEGKDYKPAGSEWNAEVNFDPFSSSPININYIRLRKFTSATSALRLGVSLAGESDKPDEDIKRSTFTINLRPGYEHHFAGTDRISPFVGAELDLAFKSSKSKAETTGGQNIDGAWDTLGRERGYLRLGANMVLGVDAYILKSLYFGTEIGFGVEYFKSSDIEYTGTIEEGGSNIEFGPNFNNSIRLGFIF